MRTSFIEKTNQSWKLKLFLFCILHLAVLFIIFVWRVRNPADYTLIIPDQIVLALSISSLTIISVLLLWFLVRCPVCKKNISSYFLRNSDANNWLTNLTTISKCPFCGYGDDKNEP